MGASSTPTTMEGVSSAVESVLSTLTSGVTPANLAALLAIALGAGFTFFLFWFGIRKLIKVFRTALTKGNLSV